MMLWMHIFIAVFLVHAQMLRTPKTEKIHMPLVQVCLVLHGPHVYYNRIATTY